MLDIRPLFRLLALVSGARTQFTGDTASLLVEMVVAIISWPQVVSVLQAKTTPSPNDDAGQTLTTGLVQWKLSGRRRAVSCRYQISVKPQGYQQAVTVKPLNLEQRANRLQTRFHAALQHGDDERYFRRSG